MTTGWKVNGTGVVVGFLVDVWVDVLGELCTETEGVAQVVVPDQVVTLGVAWSTPGDVSAVAVLRVVWVTATEISVVVVLGVV